MPGSRLTKSLRSAIAKSLGHEFNDESLLREALTHSSVGGRSKGQAQATKNNERLEFLGDRVLGLVVADLLIETYPDDAEGDLARRHSALVNAETLKSIAQEIGIGDWLIVAPGEHETGGRSRTAIQANCCEALIGALFLDGGFEVAKQFIVQNWLEPVRAMDQPPQDAKTALQELGHVMGSSPPCYRVVSQTGPAHAPEFEIEVSMGPLGRETARGSSKRVAEREAAKLLLEQLKSQFDQ